MPTERKVWEKRCSYTCWWGLLNSERFPYPITSFLRIAWTHTNTSTHTAFLKILLLSVHLQAITVYHFIPPSKLRRDDCLLSEKWNEKFPLPPNCVAKIDRVIDSFSLTSSLPDGTIRQTNQKTECVSLCGLFHAAGSVWSDICVIAWSRKKADWGAAIFTSV